MICAPSTTAGLSGGSQGWGQAAVGGATALSGGHSTSFSRSPVNRASRAPSPQPASPYSREK